jgi:hypothetical protein
LNTIKQNGTKQPYYDALKEQCLQCFGVHASNTATLRETVKGLVDRDTSRKTLIAWAMQTGCTKGHASNLLSQIFLALGLRQRRTGAGPKPSREVLELLAHAQAEYGERHLKVLRAAWRAGKMQEKDRLSPNAIKFIAHSTVGGSRPLSWVHDKQWGWSRLCGCVNFNQSK